VPLRKYSGIVSKLLQEAVLDFQGIALRSCRETINQEKMKLNKGIITSRMNINSMKEKRMAKIRGIIEMLLLLFFR